jgi:hypothetical protein
MTEESVVVDEENNVVLGYERVAAQRKSESEDLGGQIIELARRVFRDVSSGPLWSRGSLACLVARNAVLPSPDFTPPFRFPTIHIS